MASPNELRVEMNEIEKAIDALFSRAAAKTGLSDSGFDILYALNVYGDGCSQKQLCERCWLGKQTVNSSVKRLEEQGVISREPGPGRTTVIRLTEQGRAIVANSVHPIAQAEVAAQQSLSPAGLAKLIELSGEYRDALGAALRDRGLL